jgi:hypothetical protein
MLVSTYVHAETGGQESAVEAGAEEITLRLLYQLLAIPRGADGVDRPEHR